MFKIKNLLLKYIFYIYFLITKNISINFSSNVSPSVIKNFGKNVKISNNVTCFGDITIGSYTFIGSFVQLNSRINSIIIGKYCSIASGVVVQEYLHKYNRITTYYICRNILKKDIKNDIYTKGNIIIEDDVWIGANCVILSGVKIGRGAIVGAGSIVTKDVPKYAIYGGNPAKLIKERFDRKSQEAIEKTEWWKWDHSKVLKNAELFSKDVGSQDLFLKNIS